MGTLSSTLRYTFVCMIFASRFNFLAWEVLTVFILLDLAQDHKKRLSLWSYPSTGLMFLGLLCHILGMIFASLLAYEGFNANNWWYIFLFRIPGMHINKALYSFSYTCVTVGVAGILLASIYLVVSYYLMTMHKYFDTNLQQTEHGLIFAGRRAWI